MIQLPPALRASDRRLPRASFNALLKAMAALSAKVAALTARLANKGGVAVVECLTGSVVPDHDVAAGDVLVPEGLAYAGEGAAWSTRDTRARRPAADEKNIVIALEPIKTGMTGRVATAGEAWCRVDIQDEKHRFVTIGEDGGAVTAEDGGWAYLIDPAPEAADHPGPGLRDALVRFPVGGAAGESELSDLVYTPTPGAAGKIDVTLIEMDQDESLTPSNWWAGPTESMKLIAGDTPRT